MLFNFFKTSFRHILKNKVYVLISTLGMGIAIACCITAYLLVAYNIEFDDFYLGRADANIVKVIHTYENSERNKDDELETPVIVGPRIAGDIPDVEDFTRFCNDNVVVSQGNDAFYEMIRFADASFFNLFDIRFKEGSPKSFADLNTIILSPHLAKKYFADQPATGKTLTIEVNSKKYEVVVGGVLEEIPLNTSFHIHALMRFEHYVNAYDIQPDDWNQDRKATLLLKLSGGDKRFDVAQQMDQYVKLRNKHITDTRSVAYTLVPFQQHTAKESVTDSELRMPIPAVALITFSTLAGIILLIACFNLTNTTLAMTSRRMKEIAVRKVVGSAKSSIAVQFFMEVTMMIGLSIVAAVGMSLVIVPRFTEMWEIQYGLTDLNGLNIIVALLALLFVVSMLAGIYPSLYSSRQNVVALFRGKTAKGTTVISRILLTGQFALSTVVLISGITFMQNTNFQSTMDFGYDHSNLLVLSTPEGLDFERVRNVVIAQSSVVNAGGAKHGIGPYSASNESFRIDTTSFKSEMYRVAPHYLETAGLRLIEGRFFSEGEADLQSALVDQTFLAHHGLTDPLGTRIQHDGKTYQVIGVVGDHVRGFKQDRNSEYVFLQADPGTYSNLLIRTQQGQTENVRTSIESSWKQLFPGRPFQCRTQDELIYEDANVYNKNLKDIFFFLTILGCMLAGSGIYALASLNTNKRKKEIGIRKVLGASVSGIVQLLNREFAFILLISVVLGGFLGYALTNALLSSLYRLFLGASFSSLIVSAVIILVIGMFATSTTIVKAAVGNPADSLRTE
jgi:putative ABC transport system permease protein